MRMNQEPNTQTIARGKPEVTVDLATLEVDEGGRAGFRATRKIRLTATRGNLFGKS